jgi:hypothetical protein
MCGTLHDGLVVTWRWDGLKVAGSVLALVEPKTCIADLPQRLNICVIVCGLLRNRVPARRAISTFRGWFQRVASAYLCAKLYDTCRHSTAYLDIFQHAEHK